MALTLVMYTFIRGVINMENEIGNFWEMLCSDNQEIQENGFRKWDEFKQRNPYYFDDIKKKLSKGFLKTYSKINLHDFYVLNLNWCIQPLKSTEIKLLLYDYHEDYGKDLYFNMIYRKVSEYSFNAKYAEPAMTWGNDIFESTEGGMLKHRILFCNGTNIEIVFKTISLVKLKA